MNEQSIRTLLRQVADGQVSIDSAVDDLRALPFEDLGFATLDHHRGLRWGFPEVVFCQGKTPEQVAVICNRLAERSAQVLATRATPAQYEAAAALTPDLQYHEPGTRHLAGPRSGTQPQAGHRPVRGRHQRPAGRRRSRTDRRPDGPRRHAGDRRRRGRAAPADAARGDAAKRQRRHRGGGHGRRAGQRAGRAGTLSGDRRADLGGLRREFRRAGGAAGHAQQLRDRRRGRQHRQRVRRRPSGSHHQRPDVAARRRPARQADEP